MTGPAQPLIQTLQRRDTLSPGELGALWSLSWREAGVAAGSVIIPDHSRPSESCLLLDGYAARSAVVRSGGRQISALHVRGDFIDLHGLLLRVLDHSISALTDCRVAFVPHQARRELAAQWPHLGRLLFAMTAIDGAIQRNWIVCLGRRQPVAHLAQIICDLYVRLQIVGAVSGDAYDFPFTQEQLADMLGLSTVHTNRTVQKLRATGLITWQSRSVRIHDVDGLFEFADFDPTYLSLTREPR